MSGNVVYYPSSNMFLRTVKVSGFSKISTAYSDKIVASIHLSRFGGNFLCSFVMDVSGKPALVERCKDGFMLRYGFFGRLNPDFDFSDLSLFDREPISRIGAIYTLPGDKFLPTKGKAGYERITFENVMFTYQENIANVSKYLQDLQAKGSLKISKYSERFSQVPRDDSDLVKEAKEKIAENDIHRRWIKNLVSQLLPHLTAQIK